MFREQAIEAASAAALQTEPEEELHSMSYVLQFFTVCLAALMLMGLFVPLPTAEAIEGQFRKFPAHTLVQADRSGQVRMRVSDLNVNVTPGEELVQIVHSNAALLQAAHVQNQIEIKQKQVDELKADLELELARLGSRKQVVLSQIALLEVRLGQLTALDGILEAALARAEDLFSRSLIPVDGLTAAKMQSFQSSVDVNEVLSELEALQAEASLHELEQAESQAAFRSRDSELRSEISILEGRLAELSEAGATMIVADMGGRYVDLRTNRDSVVSPGDLIGAIEPKTESLFVDVYLDGASIHEVGPGNEIELSFHDFKGETVSFAAQVEQISRLHLPPALIPDWVERQMEGGYFPATLKVMPSDVDRLLQLINDGQPMKFMLRKPDVRVADIFFEE